LTKIQKHVNIIFDIILTHHAQGQQLRHVDKDNIIITKQIILDTLKCCLDDIISDLLLDRIDISDFIRVFNKTNDLNIIIKIENNNDDIMLRIITVIIKRNFKDKDIKHVYNVMCKTNDYSRLREDLMLLQPTFKRIDETFKRIRNQKLQRIKGKPCEKGKRKDSETGKCIKMSSQDKRRYSIQNKKSALKSRGKRALTSKKRKKSMSLHKKHIGNPYETDVDKSELESDYKFKNFKPYSD